VRGIKAAAFPTDVSDSHAAQGLVKRTDQLGPVTAIHWNAYAHLVGNVMKRGSKPCHGRESVVIARKSRDRASATGSTPQRLNLHAPHSSPSFLFPRFGDVWVEGALASTVTRSNLCRS